MRLVWLVIPLVLFGIVGVQEGFSQCVQNEDSPYTPCLDEITAYWYEHVSQEPFELQKQIKEAYFESEKIHLRILDIEDSRCPSDVQCIWEGQVIVNVNVVVNQEDLGNYSISLNDPLNLPIIQFEQYSLQLIKVEPYPTSTDSIHVSDYVATMKLSVTEMQESFAEEYECDLASVQIEINDYAREVYLVNTGVEIYLEHIDSYEHTSIEDLTSQLLSNSPLAEIGERAKCLKEVHDIEPDSVSMFSPQVQEILSENYEEVNEISPSLVKYATVPEFGGITMLILVTSIIIVIVSARKFIPIGT